MKKIIFDLDNTLCFSVGSDYADAAPNYPLIKQLIKYKQQGFEIIISTSRNVRTYKSNIGKINVETLPIIIEWLKRYDVPFDEIYVGKPWCGEDGFYVDDRAIRPEEFINYSYLEICKLIGINR